MTALRKDIEHYVAHEGYALRFAPNGEPDYVEKTSFANFACVHFIEKNGEHRAVLEDDGGKEVVLRDADQLSDLMAEQTFNRGDFFNAKKDCLAALDYKLKSGDISQEKYGSLVDDLENC